VSREMERSEWEDRQNEISSVLHESRYSKGEGARAAVEMGMRVRKLWCEAPEEVRRSRAYCRCFLSRSKLEGNEVLCPAVLALTRHLQLVHPSLPHHSISGWREREGLCYENLDDLSET